MNAAIGALTSYRRHAHVYYAICDYTSIIITVLVLVLLDDLASLSLTILELLTVAVQRFG